MSKLTLKTEGDTHVIVTRRFAAPPEAVYRAHTDPKIVQQWMLGPEGWTMPVCQSDLRPGGRIRYEWKHPNKGGFYLTGEFVELTPFSKIVHIERMHLPDPTPDNHVETTFEPDGSGTLMLDVARRCWSVELLDALKIDPDILPALFESSDICGSVSRDASQLTGLLEGTPIVAGAGDRKLDRLRRACRSRPVGRSQGHQGLGYFAGRRRCTDCRGYRG